MYSKHFGNFIAEVENMGLLVWFLTVMQKYLVIETPSNKTKMP